MWRAWTGSVSICFFVLGDSALLEVLRRVLVRFEELFLADFFGMPEPGQHHIYQVSKLMCGAQGET
jgi:hypothetical protein